MKQIEEEKFKWNKKKKMVLFHKLLKKMLEQVLKQHLKKKTKAQMKLTLKKVKLLKKASKDLLKK